MIRQRVRIRFSKTGDLRFIGHRDLVRVWERLFRRAQLPLSMSDGFHPKPRMSFPSALGVGIEGRAETMDVELAEEADADELRQRLQPLCPPGLQILAVESPPQGPRKPEVRSTTYEIAVPVARQAAAVEAIHGLLALTELLVERPGKAPIDLRASLDSLSLEEGVLRIRLRAGRTASARPREVLNALGLDDLELQGCRLARTEVELGEPTKTKRSNPKPHDGATSKEPPA